VAVVAGAEGVVAAPAKAVVAGAEGVVAAPAKAVVAGAEGVVAAPAEAALAGGAEGVAAAPAEAVLAGIAGPAAGPAIAAAVAGLTVKVGGLTADGRLPASAAYCPPSGLDPAEYNISPSVSWSRGPLATRSYALIMTDLDVPKDLSLINKPGVTLSAETPRVPFIHWVLIDIPPSITALKRGAEGNGFVPKGKPIGPTDHGLRGANVYSHFYPAGSELAGTRGGYDGPCPPTNDSVPHRYVTRVYALDVPSLGLSGLFFGEEALKAMQGHILAVGESQATYAANP
jgi:Raf kinase inhibitor-like YbhB/YbcL family protein